MQVLINGLIFTRKEGEKWQTNPESRAIRTKEAANNPANKRITVKRVASRPVGVMLAAARRVASNEAEAKATAEALFEEAISGRSEHLSLLLPE